MTALAGSLLSVAEIDALIARSLASTDERRAAWSSLSSADKAVVARRATERLKALAWLGRRVDDEQALPFPRVYELHTRPQDDEAHMPDDVATTLGTTAWTVEMPWDVRQGCAIQAAAEAAAARGFHEGRAHTQSAHAGVTGHGGAGMSVSINTAVATHPWAPIDPDAKGMLGRYRRTTGAAI